MSDWRHYYGSNDLLKIDIKRNGKDKYKREILRLCKLKAEVNYYENYYLFSLGVLHDDTYWNDNIQGKYYKKWVRRYNHD